MPSVKVHRALTPFAPRIGDLTRAALPDHDTLNAWGSAARLALPDGRPLRFVSPPAVPVPALAFERRIIEQGEIVTRHGNLHDVCNALAWLAFPRTKARFCAMHVADAPSAIGRTCRRGLRRDAATLLDESGLIVVCDQPELLALWRAHAWRALFHDRRADVERSMHIAVIGHGLIAKLLTPFPSLTGKALAVEMRWSDSGPGDETALPAALDVAAAAWLDAHGAELTSATLLALPIAAWPGWDVQERGAERFDDTAVFRPRRAEYIDGTRNDR